MPAPWDTILDGLTGPYGVIVALGMAMFFLWRLFREEQKENKANLESVRELTAAVKDLTIEVRARGGRK